MEIEKSYLVMAMCPIMIAVHKNGPALTTKDLEELRIKTES